MADQRTNPTEIRLAAPLELAAGDAKLPVKFSGVAYGGGKVPSYGCVIDLDTTRFAAPMPLLFEHGRGDIIGVVEAGGAKGGKLLTDGRLFSDMPGSRAESVAQLSVRGAPYQMSVGLFNFREEWVPAGQTVKVNGNAHAGPITVLRGGKVRECSIVTLGADHDSGAQFFSQPDADSGKPKEQAMTAEQIAAMEAQNKLLSEQLDAASKSLKELTDATAAAAKAKRDGDITALFAESGEKPTDEQRGVIAGMADAQFSAYAADRRSLVAKAKKLDARLFTDTATEGAKDEKPAPKAKTVNLSEIYANRAKQAVAAGAAR